MKKNEILQSYYSRIYRRYDLVNRIFTFGLDKKWRNHTIRECLSLSPSRVLDLCCGTGDLAIGLCRQASSETIVTGYDLNKEMLGIARIKADKYGVSPRFLQGNAGSMPFQDEEFDCITIGFGFRNLTFENPERDLHISEMTRVLRKGGSLFILESSKPDNIILKKIYAFYVKNVLVPVGGILSGEWNAYRYLSKSSSGFYSFEQLEDLLRKFGLQLTMNRKFMFGSANLLVAKKITG